MNPEAIQKLIEYFMRLPGIGPRQASRFAYTLLDEDESVLRGMSETIAELASRVSRCGECFRSIPKSDSKMTCDACSSDTIKAILVLEKDQDLETVQKAGIWRDGYHILGGTVPLLNEKTRVTNRIRALFERIQKRTSQQSEPIEVVLGTSTTEEGDSTALYIERILEPFITSKRVILTRPSRGLSTGAEIEYADSETLKNALDHRS